MSTVNASEVVKPGNFSVPNPFQRFYRSRAFDIMFGVVPGLPLGIYSLVVCWVSVYSAFTERNTGGLFILLAGLSLLGSVACVALLVSVFARARLGPVWRTVCTVLLIVGILDALLSLSMVTRMMSSPSDNALTLLVLLALGVSLSLAAFKQIRLLSSGGNGAVLR